MSIKNFQLWLRRNYDGLLIGISTVTTAIIILILMVLITEIKDLAVRIDHDTSKINERTDTQTEILTRQNRAMICILIAQGVNVEKIEGADISPDLINKCKTRIEEVIEELVVEPANQGSNPQPPSQPQPPPQPSPQSEAQPEATDYPGRSDAHRQDIFKKPHIIETFFAFVIRLFRGEF